MKPRTIRLNLLISDDKGIVKQYQARPMSDEELMAHEAKGYWLTQQGGVDWREKRMAAGGDYEKGYRTTLNVNGSCSCNCLGYIESRKCKHITSLLASGLLPQPLVVLINERTSLLENGEKIIAMLRERLQTLEERIATLTTPKKSTPPKRARGRRTKKCEPSQESSVEFSLQPSLAGSPQT